MSCQTAMPSYNKVLTAVALTLDAISTEESIAPLAGLSGLQSLRLSLPFRDCTWDWLQQLLRLTSLYLSDCGELT
jgi:hypothetical protein